MSRKPPSLLVPSGAETHAFPLLPTPTAPRPRQPHSPWMLSIWPSLSAAPRTLHSVRTMRSALASDRKGLESSTAFFPAGEQSHHDAPQAGLPDLGPPTPPQEDPPLDSRLRQPSPLAPGCGSWQITGSPSKITNNKITKCQGLAHFKGGGTEPSRHPDTKGFPPGAPQNQQCSFNSTSHICPLRCRGRPSGAPQVSPGPPPAPSKHTHTGRPTGPLPPCQPRPSDCPCPSVSWTKVTSTPGVPAQSPGAHWPW